MVETKVPPVSSKFAKFIEGVEKFWIQKPRSKIQETTEHSFTHDPKSTELLVFSINIHSTLMILEDNIHSILMILEDLYVYSKHMG